MINLNGKTVLITGGSKGIGEACVKLFSIAGADTFFTYNSDDKNAEIIKSRYNCRGIFKLDVTNENAVKNVVKQIIEKTSKIDILVNNAGIWERGELNSTSVEQWEKTIKTNLTGTFIVTREVAANMKKEKSGRIINISSTASQRGEANYSLYAASKGGVNAFTKSLASELGPHGINTNAVAPGWVLTPMTENVFSDKEYLQNEIEATPVRRIATAEDIAGPVLFLASDLARHINGAILSVNGGVILCG